MEEPRAAKRRLRLEIGALRREATDAHRDAASAAITRHVLAMPEYAAADRVVAYVALREEASLASVVADVLARGRGLLLPRVEGRTLAFVPVRNLAALRAGPHGLREPEGAAVAALAATDFVLAPGVAFDRHGERLGRGGGFYDRALPRGPGAPRVFGVAFAFQLVARVPIESHDRSVDGVVTDEGVIRASTRDPSVDPG